MPAASASRKPFARASSRIAWVFRRSRTESRSAPGGSVVSDIGHAPRSRPTRVSRDPLDAAQAVPSGRATMGVMPQPLAEVLAEVREMLLDPGLTRAVAAGRRRGQTPSVTRASVRPVTLKDGAKLQIVTDDG